MDGGLRDLLADSFQNCLMVSTSYASHRDLVVTSSLCWHLQFPNALQREISIHNSATPSLFLILRCSKCSFIPVQTHPVCSLPTQGIFLEGHPSRTKVVSAYFRTRPRHRACGLHTFIPKSPSDGCLDGLGNCFCSVGKLVSLSPDPSFREARTEGSGTVLH